MVQDPAARWGDDRGAMLLPEELEELEAALAEDQADEVVSGDEFLRSLRAPPDPCASS